MSLDPTTTLPGEQFIKLLLGIWGEELEEVEGVRICLLNRPLGAVFVHGWDHLRVFTLVASSSVHFLAIGGAVRTVLLFHPGGSTSSGLMLFDLNRCI